MTKRHHNFRIIVSFTIIFILGTIDFANAQIGNPNPKISLAELENRYLDSINPNSFFGSLAEFENFRINNNAFLYNKVKLEGNITFYKREFKKVNFAYDTEKNIVIAHKPDKNGKTLYVELPSEFVEKFDFKLDGYQFKFIKNSSENTLHPKLKEGIYEEVYRNQLQLYIKHYKQLQFAQNGQSEFISNRKTYLIKNGELFKIGRNRDLIKIFPEHKKEISKYLRQKKIKTQTAYNQQLKPLIQYIEGLQNDTK